MTDALVTFSGYDVEDTPRWRRRQRDEVRWLQSVLKVLGERVSHCERGILEGDAVLCGVAGSLCLIPLKIAVYDGRHNESVFAEHPDV